MSIWSKLYMLFIKKRMKSAMTSLQNNPELIQAKKEVVEAQNDFSNTMVKVFGESAKSKESEKALEEFYTWLDEASKEQIKRERANGYFRK